MVRAAIKTGALVALRKGDKAGKPVDATTEQRSLVRNIDKQTRGRLNFSGRSYKLVADVDLAGVPGRNSYEVAGHDEARRVLEGLAKQAGTTGHLGTLLVQASAKLTPDWRPPFQPDGLILLRRIRQSSAPVKDTEPAMTPSQLKAMMEKAALEIHVVDLDNKPQEGLAFKIAMPDGGSASGKLDKEGRGRAKSSSLGVFTVSFPDLDGADWNGDGAQDLPEEERSEASKCKVKQGDRLPTIATKQGFARWRTIWDFKGNQELKERRESPNILFPGDQVAIPTKLKRNAEVPGGTAEYVVNRGKEVLRVCFPVAWDSDEDPVSYTAKPDAGGPNLTGPLDADGWMEIDLPPDTNQVDVALWTDDPGNPIATYELRVGEMDPIEEVTGIQARLANLGYYDGATDGEAKEITAAAISQFRREHGLPMGDQIDDDLREALDGVHAADEVPADTEPDQTFADGEAPAYDAGSDAGDEGNPPDEVQDDDQEDGDDSEDEDWIQDDEWDGDWEEEDDQDESSDSSPQE
jgi:N-acetylmuramoyl-L-alanine amidase